MPNNAGRAFSIRTPVNVQAEVGKRSRYRFAGKEEERSNHAALLHQQGPALPLAHCLRRHQTLAYSGPPHDAVRAYVCLDCHAAASEPEIKDMGFTFAEIPDWELDKILDMDLKRQVEQSKAFYVARR